MYIKRITIYFALTLLLFACNTPTAAFAQSSTTASSTTVSNTASYNLITDKQTFVIGDTFNVDVTINSNVGINAAQATITFPKDTVQVTALDTSTSVFDFWLQQPSYSNSTGQVTFIGGSQSGVSGATLEILKITFKVKGAGPVGIIFSDGAVTASDGSGTNVLSAMNGLQLTSITTQNATLIKPPQIVRPPIPASGLPAAPAITVPLYPDPTAWYADISPFIVQWDLPRDVTDVATAIDQQPSFDPTVSEGLFDNKTFDPLTDGIWYLHVRFKNSVGWGPTAHYRIGIDSVPPLNFTVTSPDGLTTNNVVPTIFFATKDQPSGIAYYRVLINNIVATTTTLTSYTLSPQPSGKQSIIVQAVDNAGNTTESQVTLDILEAPFITIAGIQVTQFAFYITLIMTLVVGGALGWYLGRKQKEQRIRRALIAKRDVQASFGVIQKDVDDLLKKLKTETMSVQEAAEVRLVLKRISDTIEKNKQYVVDNIEEIEV